MPLEIGLLVLPDITQLDMTGPYEVFIKFPDARVNLVWKTRDPITAGGGMPAAGHPLRARRRRHEPALER